jgi:hypothetical protein
VPVPCPLLQAKQFVASRREELLELQRSLLGFEEIAVREGLKPSEAEIEVSSSSLRSLNSQSEAATGSTGLRVLAGEWQLAGGQAGRQASAARLCSLLLPGDHCITSPHPPLWSSP